ncbi:hypothetical protein [Mycolicibacterium wolinskyi]|uniref:hypothetical protein n=1 Tax=Mycolicibacterium wolinskyi TaxID=59750 RepID=UPI0039177805
MYAKRLGLVLAAAAIAVAACTTTTSGVATAPDDVTPFTTSKKPTKSPTRTRTPTATAAPGTGLPPEAFAEVRGAGIEGSDSAISDQVSLACIMAAGSFNDSKQDVVDVLIQMGSKLPPEALLVIVDVAVKYECPEYAGKLGG